MSTDIVNGQDIRMIEEAGSASLLLEAAEAVGVGGKVGGQHLESDLAAEPRILRLVNFSHATRAQEGENFVGPDRRTYFQTGPTLFDHRGRDISRWCFKEVSRLLVRRNERFDLPEQGLVTSTSFGQEGGPLLRFALQCGFQELINLLPTLRSHKSSDE